MSDHDVPLVNLVKPASGSFITKSKSQVLSMTIKDFQEFGSWCSTVTL